MKSKGAFVPHGNHGVAKKSFFNSNHHNSSSSSSSYDSDESEHHQLYHHHHSHQNSHHPAEQDGRTSWFEPIFRRFIPFAKHSQQQQQPVIIFIAWCLVIAITSTSLIDCVYAGAGTGDVASKFGSASLPVYNLGPEITTEFGKFA